MCILYEIIQTSVTRVLFLCGNPLLLCYNSTHESQGRNSPNTTRQLFSRKDDVVPFEIRIQLPKLRKEPIITQRDVFGRILEAKFSPAKYS